jgi:serine/threonine-protein kinase
LEADRTAIAAALPGYEIGGEVGRGAWGIVLDGTHRHLGRKVAIKQLPEAFARTELVRRRFGDEARLLATLDHPHIVPIFDYVEQDGLCLLVMEWLPGGSVWDRFSGNGLTPETSCAAVMATCAGLEFAHRRGVLHRDIKPENLIFNAEGILKVTDFGIAKVISGSETLATRSGEILGTPAYMSPEQVLGTDLGPPTDVYSAGTMLYELLSGRLPFPEDPDPLALAYRHVREDPEPLSRTAPHVSKPLAEVTMRALAKNASDRFASAEEFGLAVGAAAAATWGPGWLERSGLTILSSGPIAAAAERFAAGASQDTSAGPMRRSMAARRPDVASALARSPSEVVPVHSVAEVPDKPAPYLGVAVLGMLLAAVAAFAGSGRQLPAVSAPPGAIAIGGADPAGAETVELELGTPIPVRVDGSIARALQADTVGLDLSVAGIPIAGATEPLAPAGSAVVAEADLSRAKFLAPSSSTVRMELSGATTPAVLTFRVRSDQPVYVSIPALAGVVMSLFAFANVEATFKPLRRGRKGASGVVMLAAMGALFGLVIQIAVWLLLSREPSVLSISGSALAGAGSGLALGLSGLKMGRRRRPRGRVKAGSSGPASA